MKKVQNDGEMVEEYDFSHGIRGRYAEKYKEGANIDDHRQTDAPFISVIIPPATTVFPF
jgi:hypothetical protein